MPRLVIDTNYAYTCLDTTPISSVLQLLGDSNYLSVVVVTSDNQLAGIISNGDIIRNLSTEHSSIDTLKALDLMNKYPTFLPMESHADSIEHLLAKKIRVVPIIDDNHHLVSVAYYGSKSFFISTTNISEANADIYSIAEIGVNHQGDTEEAISLIRAAHDAGFNAVKFQFRDDDLYCSRDSFDEDLSVQYIQDELKRVNLTFEDEVLLVSFAKQLNLHVIVTPFTHKALERATKLNIDALKIASCDLTNIPLIQKCIDTGLPLILSTGMSFEHEIISTASFVSARTSNYIFLHCNSTYPAPPSDINLAYIPRLSEITSNIVGYSSHDGDVSIPLSSISLGARCIEVHITSDKKSIGTDHQASLPVNELKQFVSSISSIALAIGSSKPRVPSQGEVANKFTLSKSLCYAHNFAKNHSLSADDLVLRSPGDGFSYSEILSFLNKPLMRDVQKFSMLSSSDFESPKLIAADSEIEKPQFPHANWGIPVRYRDYKSLHNKFNAPVYEFHMSSKDLLLDPSDFVDINNGSNCVVHAIEQYNDGFILDLCSLDDGIRLESVKRLTNLVNHSLRLAEFFPSTANPKIVVNVGGFTSNNFASASLRDSMLKSFDLSVSALKPLMSSCTLLPQTMPPYPWHQGGRSFHNLCTSVETLKYISSALHGKVCLDISHSYMWCNYTNESFLNYVNSISDLISHVHVSDASRTSQEGLQIGTGHVPIPEIMYTLTNSEISWIVEIWQGHLCSGKGFSTALQKLSKLTSTI